ncbi:MAG: hypothetical protein AAGJ50_15230 [Pseudomonadota bacterium]
MPRASSGSFVTIEHFYDAIEARIVAGRLEAVGIPTLLPGIHHVSVNWMIAVALGGIPLQVPAAFADDALAVLAEDVALDDDNELCPKCGSGESERDSIRWRVAMLLVHAVQLPVPWKDNRRKCQECGFLWELESET